MNGIRRFLSHRYTVRAAQIVIGLVFAFSGLAKIGDLGSFAMQVHNFRVMPIWPENLVAMTLPWLELTASMSLLLNLRPRSGALITTALMALFVVLVLLALVRGLDIDCGCFGTATATSVGITKLAENMALLGVSAVALIRPRS